MCELEKDKGEKAMNKVILMGRLTRDPDVRYTQGQEPMCIARYTLAVDRRVSKKSKDEQPADFISCVAFGKAGEFIEKYVHKGTKICVTGRIQTGSYTNREGQKVYTTDVVAEEQEFAESKSAAPGVPEDQMTETQGQSEHQKGADDPAGVGFMDIPEDINEELPFN